MSREHDEPPRPLPPELALVARGCLWTRVETGLSDCEVYRLSWPDHEEGGYLKIAAGEEDVAELVAEREMLDWLRDRLPVPEVHAWARFRDQAYLLTTEVAGSVIIDAVHNPESLVAVFARGLRMIHDVPARDGPLRLRPVDLVAQAERRVERGLVKEDEFEPRWIGRTAGELHREIQTRLPEREEPVLTHGDYYLENVIADDESLSGIVDWGRGAVACRYRDLAAGAKSITHHLGEQWVPTFYAIYGLPEPDPRRIEFFSILDEFY